MVAGIEASLRTAGFRVSRDSVAGRQAVIARSRRLRSHLFVLVAVFKAGMAGRDHLDRFLDEAGQYAATVKGGLAPRAGATAVAVAVLEGGGEGAGDWAGSMAARPPAGRARAFPVLVDVPAGRVDCPPAPADLHRLVQEHVVPSRRMV